MICIEFDPVRVFYVGARKVSAFSWIVKTTGKWSEFTFHLEYGESIVFHLFVTVVPEIMSCLFLEKLLRIFGENIRTDGIFFMQI